MNLNANLLGLLKSKEPSKLVRRSRYPRQLLPLSLPPAPLYRGKGVDHAGQLVLAICDQILVILYPRINDVNPNHDLPNKILNPERLPIREGIPDKLG